MEQNNLLDLLFKGSRLIRCVIFAGLFMALINHLMHGLNAFVLSSSNLE